MAARELGTTKFSTEKHSGANMLMNFGLVESQQLNPFLTKLWGMGEDGLRFPLLAATEGQGTIKKVLLSGTGDTQYYYNIEGRRRHTITLLNAVANPIGKGGTTFELDFTDNWLIYQHTAISPSGVQCRVQSEGVRTGNGYRYRLVVMGSDPNREVKPSDMKAGAVWAMGAPSIPASKSDGNRSNNQAPFKATNQYGYHRFSKGIEGNMGDRVVNIQFDLADGAGTTDQWMPYEMKRWELDRRQMLEEDLWFSEYNRNAQGVVELVDEFTGEFVPKGAGAREQIKSVGNLETYSDLSLKVFDNLIDRIYSSHYDATTDEIICYCGHGFNRLFQQAIDRDIKLRNYFQAMGDATIDGSSSLLSYGRYYNKYKMLNGKTLALRPVKVFDNGIRAEQQREGAGVNPELMHDGLPIMSYTAAFIDHSIQSNGEANVQFVAEEGREYVTGIYKGMANLPNSWAVAANSPLSSRKDIAYYEVITSQGLNISNPTTSFMLELSK